jgi:enamine deaminase RidA (YjgF/YER057c/UK114 family)
VHINALLNFLDGHRPGTALIGVAKLGNPKLKFEIEAIAALKSATALQVGDLA